MGLERILPFLLVFSLFLPIADHGYAFVFLFNWLIFLVYVVARAKQLRKKFIIITLFALITWSLFSILASANLLENIWDLREFIRVPLTIIVLFYYSENEGFPADRLLKYFALFILLDFILLYAFSDSNVSKKLLQSVAMSGMADYLDDYWRYIGLGGNPNLSALIYSIFIIISLHVLTAQKLYRDITGPNRLFLYIACGIALFLLIITFSRTGIVALGASLLFFFTRPKYAALVFLGVCVLGIYFAFFLDFDIYDKLIYRFSSFTSMESRISHWELLFSNYSLVQLVFGSKFYVSVIDNDYIYFIYRFGIFLGALLLLAPLFPLIKIREKNIRYMYFNFVIFFYISAFPGGSLSHPKTYFFLLAFGSMLSTNNKIKRIREFN